MAYSLREAAAAVGLDRSTILRSIKGGRLSATKTELGEWRIEPVELHRVYPPVPAPAQTRNDAQADALVALLREQLADMRAQRDSWQSVAERLSLAAPKPVTWWKWWGRQEHLAPRNRADRSG